MSEHSWNLRYVGKLLRGVLDYSNANSVDQAADYIETLAQTVAGLRAERERLIIALTPSRWTMEHSVAWHFNIQDTAIAFAVLREIALASPPAAYKCTWENTGNFTWTSACGNQFTSDEDGIGSDMPFCCFCGKRIDLISPPAAEDKT